MYKNRPLGPYRTLPAPLPGQRLIGDRYATKNGLLKRYRADDQRIQHGAFTVSLMYHRRFEKGAVAVFREIFPQADAADAQAFKNYLRGYVGSWDYAYLFQLVEAMIRIRKTLGGMPSAAEQAFLDIAAAVDRHDDTLPWADDFFGEEFQLMQQQGGILFDLLQADIHYTVLAKIMLSELAWANSTPYTDPVVTGEIHRFISGYLVPRMIHGPFADAAAEHWRTYISERIPGWWV
ncbi:hypothetical protein FMM01_11880 [Schleiferilactobacillus harbinensis]|uniref:hypothetical protein n=1 Tax=Schleiferilactobacillus harbinensis TaxID=304207 RepID=UPI00123A16BE|nr:hypothetical protein [Schleiferilactobacillus harbinensis]QEU47948.1 hypothetical protein FMM01_11880 [Schleiferilactobacillus harbinensis]